MVVGDGTDGAEAAKVVFIGVVETVPCDYIEGGVSLSGGEEATCKFRQERVGCGARRVFDEGSCRGLEITGIGEAIGTDGTEFRQLEMILI